MKIARFPWYLSGGVWAAHTPPLKYHGNLAIFIVFSRFFIDLDYQNFAWERFFTNRLPSTDNLLQTPDFADHKEGRATVFSKCSKMRILAPKKRPKPVKTVQTARLQEGNATRTARKVQKEHPFFRQSPGRRPSILA